MKIKICGIKTLTAAQAVENYGSDFIGCIFYKKSRRYISPELAAQILKPLKRVKKVGVFVNEKVSVVNEISALVNLDYVQLHGNENADYAAQIHKPIIKAYRFNENFNVDDANNFPCEFILIDSFVKGQVGGTGQTFNWENSADKISQITKPIFIAGGISLENFSDAARIFKPYALDVSGSLEIDGEKSVDKIKSFMTATKNFGE